MNIIVNAFINTLKFCFAKKNVALWPNGPTGKDYARGLVRRQGMGSYIVGFRGLRSVRNFLADCNWRRCFPPNALRRPGCTYYVAEIPRKYNALTGVVRIRDLSRQELLRLIVVDGPHGPELRLSGDGGQGCSAVGTDVVYAIVEDGMLSTWYPGPLTAPVPADVRDVPRALWSEDWAVKY
jgi:hypothetical protein